MTSLDDNLFFQTLVNTFKKRYDEILDNCYHVCVPVNGSYEPKQLNDKFICSHILKPSPLLKSHFLSYNNKQNFHVQIDDHLIKVTRGFGGVNRETIRILNEEKAYNNANQKYSIFICEKPLISALNSKLNYESFDVRSNEIKVDTFQDCKQFLQQISPTKLDRLNEEIKQLINTYILLPDYMDDVAAKLKKIIDHNVAVFADECRSQNRTLRNSNELLSATIESYSIGLLYDQLISMIEKRMNQQDEIFVTKCRAMSNQTRAMKPTDFGAQKAFENFAISETIHAKFDELQSSLLCTPLAKLNCMRQTLDAINDQLKQTVDQHEWPFTGNGSRDKIYIMSDDLLAAVICSLCICQPSHFCSTIEFIHSFSWYLPQNSELGYSFVTFKVAKEYILNCSQEHTGSQTNRNIQQKIASKSRSDKDLSSLDEEIDKMTKIMSKNSVSNTEQLPQKVEHYQELGGFLGSLADNFMTASGQKN